MKYTKERHIVFQEADVTEILIDWLKRSGEKDLPAPEEIELSFDKYKHGNEITLMFDDISKPDLEEMWTAELEELRYDKGVDKMSFLKEKSK